MKASRPHYNQFTPEERVRLVLAARARGDALEAARLRYSCPREKVGEFTELLDRMERLARGFFFVWLEVSHRVLRSRLSVAHFAHLVRVEEVLVRVAPPGCKKEVKIGLREDRALLVACEAQWKKWSAGWKGIEAAITRFCAERRLTTQELFPKAPRSGIDEARAQLDADVPADPRMENLVYERAAVLGLNTRGKK